MLNIELDREFLQQVYDHPGLPDTGLSLPELQQTYRTFADCPDGASHTRRKAEAFAFLCRSMRIGAYSRDLFVSLDIWGRHQELFSKLIQPKWMAEVREHGLGDAKRLWDDFTRRQVIIPNWDYAHSVPDWDAILQLGLPGLLARARQAQADFLAAHGDAVTDANREFFAAVISAYENAVALLERAYTLAVREKCQPETIAALRQLCVGAPRTLYEAMQLIWLYYQLSEYGDYIQTRTFGNLDRTLYPYYQRDLANGTVTEADVRNIFRNFFLKITSMNYYYGHPCFFGGTQADGSSAINELSYLMLEEYGNLGIYDPKLQIKVAANTPEAFLNLALSLIRSGRNSIAFVGEPCIMKAMTANGFTAEEARLADIKGCYEYTGRGNTVATNTLILETQRTLLELLAMNRSYDTFEELLDHYKEYLRTLCADGLTLARAMEPYLGDINPSLLFSGACARALELGVDGYSQGALHQNSDFWLLAPATTANSLTMIRKYVFQKQAVTLDELRQALRDNWQGYEKLQRMIAVDVDKFGNNRPQGDDLMVWLCETIASFVNGQPNGRGGIFATALHAANRFISVGKQTPATPDGRFSGEELTKNATGQQGSNCRGVTAMIQSSLKLDPSHFMADYPLDIMLHPAACQGDDGLTAMRALLMRYILGGGHAIHFNVFNPAVLRDAQANPEQYRDLQVRICGWNVLWNSLTRQEQDAYIFQAEATEQSA